MRSLAILLFFCSVSVAGELLPYSPSEILQKVESKEAVEGGGPSLAGSGLGTSTYCWKLTDDHYVFFLLRDGKSFSEYREEHRKSGRYMSIREVFLTVPEREKKDDHLKLARTYICRETRYIWFEDVWVGEDRQYKRYVTDAKGQVQQESGWSSQYILRQTLTIRIRPAMLSHEKEYYVEVLRPASCGYEPDFKEPDQDGAYFIDRQKVIDNQCAVRVEWSVQAPKSLIRVSERIPNPKEDATPFLIRTKPVFSRSVMWTGNLPLHYNWETP